MIQEIYFFDKDLNSVATIDLFENLEWNENYNKADTFKLDIEYEQVTDNNNLRYEYYKNIFEILENYRLTKNPVYVTLDNKDDLRVCKIDRYEIDETKNTITITGSGVFEIFTHKQDRNMEFIPSEADDNIGYIACDILNYHINADDVLKNIIVADKTKNKIGSEIYYITESGDSVFDSIKKLLDFEDIGFKTILDYSAKKINVIFYKGQQIPSLSVSVDDENLTGNSFEFDIGSYKNYATISGTFGEEEKLVVELVDLTDGNLRYDMNIESNKKSGSMTESQYRQALIAEAKMELKKSIAQESYDIDISDGVALDIGEVVVVKVNVGFKELAKEVMARGIKYKYTSKEYKRTVSFGEAENLKTDLQFILGVK